MVFLTDTFVFIQLHKYVTGTMLGTKDVQLTLEQCRD